jgi:hypothetical protein
MLRERSTKSDKGVESKTGLKAMNEALLVQDMAAVET